MKRTFRTVTLASPCPICLRPDWCRASEDGDVVLCRRVSIGAVRAGRYRDRGEYFVHYPHGRKDNDPLPTPCYSPQPAAVRADADTLNQVYGKLLSFLPLDNRHVEELRRRGLTGDLRADGYRTWPLSGRARLVSRLIRDGFERHLPFVPGMVQKQGRDDSRYWTLAASPGLAIPIRDCERRIVALLIRPDDQIACFKYIYLSSRKYDGPGPGSPIHVPLFTGDKTTVVVTEGTLKSNVATALSGLLTIGLPGVSATNRVAAVLRQLGATTARLAFDADARRNLNVARPLKLLADNLLNEGFVVELCVWNESDGKGVDDLLVTAKTPRVLTGAAAFVEIDAIVNAAKANESPPARRVWPDPKRPGHFIINFTVGVR